MLPRDVKKVVQAVDQSDGNGARVRRTVGRSDLPNLDPFLLLDEFHVSKPAGFPDHPHRGMQTVTYMLQGAFTHTDSKGRTGTIGPGDLQWMTAGRGIVHSEMPAADGDNAGLQLWVNLAARNKMTKPQYQELRADQIPTATSPDGNVSVKVIAGTCYGVESPVFTLTPTLLWDVTMIFPSPSLSPTTTCNEVVFEQQVPDHYNTFIYVLHGTVVCGKRNRVEAVCGSCVVFGPGQCVRVKLPCDSGDGERGRRCRFVVAAGEPLNEPVVQHGPFVMNNWDQIMKAFRDFSEGKF